MSEWLWTISPPEQNLKQDKAQQGEAAMAQDVEEEGERMSPTQEDDERENFINDEDLPEEEEKIEKKLLKIENIVNMKMKMRKRLGSKAMMSNQVM